MEKEKEEIKPQGRLSPTSINSFLNCPRCYYLQYIGKMKPPVNIHLIKGRIIHSVLEDFFKRYKKDLEESLLNKFNSNWDKSIKDLEKLELSEEEIKKHKKDCVNMIIEYYHTFRRQMNTLLDLGKAENDSHAYYLLKPKFRELWVEDKELHCCGYIDRVNEDYDGVLTLGDYKTSSKFGLNFPTDYKRQLAIYALLYKRLKNKTPDEVAVDFLRYGEVDRYEVTDKMLEWAENTIKEVYEKTRSINIDDYQPSPTCSFKELCVNNKEADERVEELKKYFKEVKK